MCDYFSLHAYYNIQKNFLQRCSDYFCSIRFFIFMPKIQDSVKNMALIAPKHIIILPIRTNKYLFPKQLMLRCFSKCPIKKCPKTGILSRGDKLCKSTSFVRLFLPYTLTITLVFPARNAVRIIFAPSGFLF